MITTTCRRQQLAATDQIEIMRTVMRQHPALDPHSDADFDNLYKHFTTLAETCGTAAHGLDANCCGACRSDIRTCMQNWWCE